MTIKNKPFIKQIIVVEGKNDTNRLQQLYHVKTIETNGLGINDDIISLLKEVSKNNEIILFLDPDGPGEKIRKICQKHLLKYKQAFIDKKLCNFKNKIGVAEASDQAIISALKNLIDFDNSNYSLSWIEYLNLNLNSKEKRQKVCDHFKISLCNHKQLYKRLNMMNIKIDTLREFLK